MSSAAARAAGSAAAGLEVVEQHEELVAAVAGEQPARLLDAAEPRGDPPQQPVARHVAERVVDELEVVEVDEQQRDGALALARAGHRGAQPRVELRAVGQPGQRIVAGQPAQLRLGLLEPLLERAIGQLGLALCGADPGRLSARGCAWRASVRTPTIGARPEWYLRPCGPVTLADGDVVARALARVDLARAGDLLLLVLDHLEPLGDPAARARDREQDGEHADRHAQRLVDQARVEVDVRVELALDEVVVLERDLLELERDLQQRVDARDLEDLVGRLLDDLRARVVVLVDPVAEAHQALLALLHARDEVRDVLLGADPAQHPQHRLVGAAVQRPVEGGDAGRDRRVGVDLRGADRAYRVRRAVLLVIGVQDEEDVQGLLQPGIRLVLELGHLVEHVEEVAGVAQVVVRIDVRLPHRVPERERRERRHLRDQADHVEVAELLVVDLVRVGIERRQRAGRREQHPHRVRVVAEALHEALDVLVHERVDRDLVRPLVELRLVRELAVDEQVGDLEVGRASPRAARSGSRGTRAPRPRRRGR